ncbi:MAG: hypothetical protein HQL36_01475 [Alphaproteobacteria bacterium]|nr:hypothetical protein [Alphaproteobacteria bacterium]
MSVAQEKRGRFFGGISVILLVTVVAGLIAPRMLTKTETLPEEAQAALLTPASKPAPKVEVLLLPPPPEKVLAGAPAGRPGGGSSAHVGEVAEEITPLKPHPPEQTKPTDDRPTIQSVPRPNAELNDDVGVAAENGRTLLRILEHGKGPAIEIAWPDDDRKRSLLFDHFRDCHGMRVALMDLDGRLFTESEETGHPWDLNLDRYSGFVRRPSGAMSGEEMKAAEHIKMHHALQGHMRQVRLFPRNSDAILLGSLREIVGDRYRSAQSITAAYRFNGHAVQVNGIVVDGEPVPGHLILPSQRTCR